MGVMYYLARKDTRTLFEIGKFSEIANLFRDLSRGRENYLEFEVPATPDLQLLLCVAMGDLGLGLDSETYATELTRRIIAFAGGQLICLVSDGGDLDRYRCPTGDLQIAGSVYPSAWQDAES